MQQHKLYQVFSEICNSSDSSDEDVKEIIEVHKNET